MNNILAIAISIIFIIYIYYRIYNSYKHEEVHIEDFKPKTGDIILFKHNITLHGLYTYYTHIGIVFIDPDDVNQTPLIFEIVYNGNEIFDKHLENNKPSVILTNFKDRVTRYYGSVFIKPLNKPLTYSEKRAFKEFIKSHLKSKFKMPTIYRILKQLLRIEYATYHHDCAEIVYKTLVHIGLLSWQDYCSIRLQPYFMDLIDLENVKKGYMYPKDPIKLQIPTISCITELK